ncbi:hypothetical protein BHM03_00044930 [Ensete ventricosum]|nr:hypothetical protein BHM03_00044930 [Ensete ventricosum]
MHGTWSPLPHVGTCVTPRIWTHLAKRDPPLAEAFPYHWMKRKPQARFEGINSDAKPLRVSIVLYTPRIFKKAGVNSRSKLLFDLLTKEFELNLFAKVRPRPTTASLLGLTQGSEESLA